MVAGLGVGGIAVALAVQNILGDLFASLSIVLDKPFTVGDFLIIDDYLGSVEHIGLKKRTSWKTSLRVHWDVMAATDFFTVEVWTARGLVTYYVSFVMRLKTRSVHIAGVTTAPNGAYMKQVARNPIDVSAGFLVNSRYLIMDRDTKHTEEFGDYLDREGVKPVRRPVRAPNCNAFAARFVRSIKDECLNRMILFGEASLRRALREYVAHFHSERNHQGVGNRLLEPLATVSTSDEPIQCRERLGGMLNFYYREAA